jgi:hypothetical protein
MVRFVGLLVTFFAAFLVWALGQLGQFVIYGYWNWTPEGWIAFALVIAFFEIVLGLPFMLLFARFRHAPGWLYVISGVVVGVVPMFLFVWSSIDVMLDDNWPTLTHDGTKPLTSGEIQQFYLQAIEAAVTNLHFGLYSGLIGAAGGLAYWLSVRHASK